jgi:hypothetical protein
MKHRPKLLLHVLLSTMRGISMRKLLCLTWLVAFHCCAASAFAEVWTSPDGVITVTPPNSSKYDEVEPTRPMLAEWTSKDKSSQFMVTQVPLPGDEKPTQESAVKLFLKSIQGKLVSSRSYTVGDCTVFEMSARGDLKGNPISAIRSIVVVEEQIYTVAAIGKGDSVLDSKDAKDFFGSFTVLGYPAQVPNLSHIDQNSDAELSKRSQLSDTTKLFLVLIDIAMSILTGLVLLFVIYGIVVLVQRRSNKLEPDQQKSSWINLYMLLASICAVGGIWGCRGNAIFLMRGRGIPVEPAERQAFIIGLFVVPAILFVLALVLAFLGRRKSNREKMKASDS